MENNRAGNKQQKAPKEALNTSLRRNCVCVCVFIKKVKPSKCQPRFLRSINIIYDV